MVDFLVELPKPKESHDVWQLQIDGSSNRKGEGVCIILEGPDEIALEQSIRFTFETSNNQAEYEAPIMSLKLTRELGIWEIHCKTDSQLVAGQVKDVYQTKEPLLQKYYQMAKVFNESFIEFAITHIHREQNDRVDIL